MNQQEHIEKRVEISDERKIRAAQIQKAYEDCINDFSDAKFAALIQQMDSLCMSWVVRNLMNAGCYNDETAGEALQEARLAVWSNIKEDIKQNRIRDNFPYYAFGIYKIKALDIARKVLRKEKKLKICSFEEPVGSDGKTISDFLPTIEPDYGEEDKKRVLYDEIFRIYIFSLLNSVEYPPKELSLYYARVLPHLLNAIIESKASSPKWAYERMENSSIQALKEDSEETIQKKIDPKLSWCEAFLNQLKEESKLTNPPVPLGDIIFTACFNKKKIEYWSDQMHKKTFSLTIDEVSKKPELQKIIEEYVSSEDHMYLLAGKENCR